MTCLSKINNEGGCGLAEGMRACRRHADGDDKLIY